MFESHTRQGCARGQRHGTLDREDPNLGTGGMWAATSHSAMKEQGRVPPLAPKAKLKTIAAGNGCWCGGSTVHDGPHLKPLPWAHLEEAEAESVKRLTDALVRISFVAGAQGVGIAVLCERGIPRFVAPCEAVPLGEIRWYGSRPLVDKKLDGS